MKTIQKDLLNTLKLVISLSILGAIVRVTGTTFFEVNLFPLISLVVIITIIIWVIQSNKETKKWIMNKLKRLFK